MNGSFVITADHPALPGHFPGRPIVPGVVLLDEVMALIAQSGPGLPGTHVTGFPRVKFLQPVRPGERLVVVWRDGRFSGAVEGTTVLQGQFVLEPPG